MKKIVTKGSKRRRHYLDPYEWEQFQRFINSLSVLQESIDELDDGWATLCDYLTDTYHVEQEDTEDVHDTIRRVADIVRDIAEPPIVESNNIIASGVVHHNAVHKSRKYKEEDIIIDPNDCYVSDVLIKEISDGRL